MASLTKDDINTIAKLNAIIEDGDIASDAAITEAINALKGNVPEAGNTLAKLYSIIQGLGNLKREDIDTLAEINAILSDASLATMADLEEVLVGLNGGVPIEGNSLAKLYNLIAGKKDKFSDYYPSTYFVSPLVTDDIGVKGDYTLPFTPARAYELAVPGDTIAFLPGLYYMTGNIAKNGVVYTTFGGKALLVTGGFNLFDYESLEDASSDIVIDGDFEFSHGGETVFKFKDSPTPRRYRIRWSYAFVQAGTFIRMPAVLTTGIFEGNIEIAFGCGAPAIECVETAVTTGAGVMNLIIVNNSHYAHAIKPWFSGFRFNISYIGAEYGLFAQPVGEGADNNVFVLNIKQDVTCTTYLCAGEYSGTIQGGLVFLYQGSINLNARLNNCELHVSEQTSCKVTAVASSVTIHNDLPKMLKLDGVWYNTIYHSNTQSPCIMEGEFYDLQFNTSAGQLKITGYVKVIDDNSVLVSNTDTLEVTGKLVGNAPEVIRLAEDGSAVISGYIKQLAVDRPAIMFEPDNYTIALTLRNAIIQSGSFSQESILAEAPGRISLRLYGNSYSNRPIAGGAEINYRIGSSVDFIVDLNVDVSDE
ncbi:hypothetical protein ACFQ21_05155 [Ohtaekwangia kribbensis]|uniref:Uncharacterized protein n=1 Tax=Ohtaekwangia kribbensis TaxID=688913 RepID=A0ABW3JZV3_9BACT